MQASELRIYLSRLTDDLLDVSSEIIAATAVDYYRDSFRRGGFDGQAWTPLRRPKRRGTILRTSGALAASILPAIVSRHRVVISAGNAKVSYAQAHNEGVSGTMSIGAHTRTIRGGRQVEVRAHQRHGSLPQRRFIGRARELDQEVRARIEGYLQSIR